MNVSALSIAAPGSAATPAAAPSTGATLFAALVAGDAGAGASAPPPTPAMGEPATDGRQDDAVTGNGVPAVAADPALDDDWLAATLGNTAPSDNPGCIADGSAPPAVRRMPRASPALVLAAANAAAGVAGLDDRQGAAPMPTVPADDGATVAEDAPANIARDTAPDDVWRAAILAGTAPIVPAPPSPTDPTQPSVQRAVRDTQPAVDGAPPMAMSAMAIGSDPTSTGAAPGGVVSVARQASPAVLVPAPSAVAADTRATEATVAVRGGVEAPAAPSDARSPTGPVTSAAGRAILTGSIASTGRGLRLADVGARVLETVPLTANGRSIGPTPTSTGVAPAPAIPTAPSAMAAPPTTADRAVATRMDRRSSPAPEPGVGQPLALASSANPTPRMPLPSTGAVAPAGEMFAAAIHAAGRSSTVLGDGTLPLLSPAAPQPIAAAAAAGGNADPSLDLRQGNWPGAMIDHIEKLRDAADAVDHRIRVVPDALGGIDVSVRRRDDGVQVTLRADHAATQAMLAEARPQLTAMAEARGIRLADPAPGGPASGGTVGTGGTGQGGMGGDPATAHGRRQPAAFAPSAPTPAPADSDPSDPADGRVA